MKRLMFILSMLCIKLPPHCQRHGPSSLLSQLFLYKAISQRQDVVLKNVFGFFAGQANSWLGVTNKSEKYVRRC